MHPSVSVIIPSFKSVHTLPRAIDSVLMQGYQNFEIIVVDDRSDDGTNKVVERYASIDPRIHYCCLAKNSGPANARNVGVAIAKGEFLAFLDADDEWMPDKLGPQVEFLVNNLGVDVVFTDCLNINTTSKVNAKLSEINGDFLSRLSLKSVNGYSDFFILEGPYRKEMYRKFFVLISSVLLRRSVFNRVSGFNQNRFGTEDVDFFVRTARQSIFSYWYKEKVFRYQADNGISTVNERWLFELISYHKFCLSSPEYDDLRELAQHNLLTVYRYLIVFFALKKMPVKGYGIFRESLRLGFYPRLAIYSLAAFAGPSPFILGQRLISLSLKNKR